MSDSSQRNGTPDAVNLGEVWGALEGVTDPEIPVLSVVDMGIIAAVRKSSVGIEIDVTPTFAACPATEVICRNIQEAVRVVSGCEVRVRIVFDPPWRSERISEAGRAKLLAIGLSPPQAEQSVSSEFGIGTVECPFCRSDQTALESLFGPTLCRSIHYCNACRQSFEHFKPV